MTTAIETPKLFAVAHLPGTKRPYIVRTIEAEYAYSRKVSSSKKIMELIEAGYKLDQTGQTCPAIPAEGKYIVYGPETGDWSMYLDRQFVGAARTETEANVTLNTLVDEIARHTRVTTADMEADAAEAVAVAEYMTLTEDPDPVIKNLCTTHADKATWYARGNGPVDKPCDECAPAVPPPTRDELRKALDGAITARLPIPRDTPEWDAARAVVVSIVRELETHFPGETYVCITCGSDGSPCVNCNPDPIPPQTPDDVPADMQLFTCDLCLELKSGAELTPDDGGELIICLKCADGRCSSCGDPSTGLCPACQESGEQPPYAVLADPGEAATDPLDDVPAPPFGLPEPYPPPSDDDAARRCKTCGKPAKVLGRDGLYCRACWHAWLKEGKGAVERLAPEPEQHDPCAEVRRALEEVRLELRQIGEIAQTECGIPDPKYAMRSLRDERHEFGIVLQLVLDQVEHGYDRLGWTQEQIRAFESIPSGLLTIDLRVSLIATIRTALGQE